MTTLREQYDTWSEPYLGDDFSAQAMDARGLETRRLAARVLAAPVGTVVGGGRWVPELTVAVQGGEPSLLTADGKPGDRGHWCLNETRCKASGDWVYYERWAHAGRASHGWLCGVCRRLVQSG